MSLKKAKEAVIDGAWEAPLCVQESSDGNWYSVCPRCSRITKLPKKSSSYQLFQGPIHCPECNYDHYNISERHYISYIPFEDQIKRPYLGRANVVVYDEVSLDRKTMHGFAFRIHWEIYLEDIVLDESGNLLISAAAEREFKFLKVIGFTENLDGSVVLDVPVSNEKREKEKRRIIESGRLRSFILHSIWDEAMVFCNNCKT